MKMLIFLLSTVSTREHPYPDVHIVRRVRVGVAPLSLAVLLKKLGARGSVSRIAAHIHMKCGSVRLQRLWLKIVFTYRRVISFSSKHPFTMRRFWYIYHRSRKSFVRIFLKSFIKCGRVPGATRAIRKIIISYAATRHERKYKLLKFLQRIKKIFFRKKIIRSREDNNTIYPTHIIKKLVKMKRLMIRCIIKKRMCLRRQHYCDRYRKFCKRAFKIKQQIGPKVKKIFIDYFSSLWYNYIINPSVNRIRVYIVRRYENRWLKK